MCFLPPYVRSSSTGNFGNMGPPRTVTHRIARAHVFGNEADDMQRLRLLLEYLIRMVTSRAALEESIRDTCVRELSRSTSFPSQEPQECRIIDPKTGRA